MSFILCTYFFSGKIRPEEQLFSFVRSFFNEIREKKSSRTRNNALGGFNLPTDVDIERCNNLKLSKLRCVFGSSGVGGQQVGVGRDTRAAPCCVKMTMKSFCPYSRCSHRLNILTIFSPQERIMLRRFRCVGFRFFFI